MGEAELISFVRKRFASASPEILVGAGSDDCAVLDLGGGQLAASVDMFVEGTHWDATALPEEVGWKALAASLSDLAAGGCRPVAAFVSLALRRGAGTEWALRLGEGVAECADAYACPVAGGDTTSTDGNAAISVAVLGKPLRGAVLRRSGAREGDALCVTGSLGGSILGRHLHPLPRLAEIKAILEQVEVHACMDISDGLALDLHRMLAESGKAALLQAEAVPVSAEAERLARRSGREALNHAVADGEDFELLFAVSTADWEKLALVWPKCGTGVALSRIGTVEAGSGVRLERAGRIAPLAAEGYWHEF